MGYEDLPLPFQIFIPCFVLLVVIGLIAGVFQMCMHPYGHYGYGYGGGAMMMGALAASSGGMGGPMIAPSVSMTYSTMPVQAGYGVPVAGGVVQQQQQMPPPPQQSTTSESSVGNYPKQSTA